MRDMVGLRPFGARRAGVRRLSLQSVRSVGAFALTVMMAVVGFGVATLTVPAPPAYAQQPMREPITVAVMPFEASVHRDFNRLDVGRQLTNLITDKLVDMGEYLVVERDRISSILAEQDLGTAGRIDPARAVEIGRLLGAQVLVFGSVTRFEMSSSGGISFGGLSLSGTIGRTGLTGRIVDATTGVILGSVQAEGEAVGASVSIRSIEGISFRASEFQDSALGRAVTRAVDDFVEQMSDVITENEDRVFDALARSQMQGTIVALIDNGVVINIGQVHGIRREQRLEVFRLMEIAGLSAPVRIPVGVVRVISVDPEAAVAVFESMTSSVEVGDAVAPQ